MDGEPPQEEDFSQIPLIERSQHKNWKARLSAYTDIISKAGKTASDADPFFRPYISDGPLLKKWCLDANVVAQEKGIEAVLAIVKESGENSARVRSDVVPGIVEKALGNSRAGTKKKGTELCAMFVEVENGAEGVLSDVLVGLDSKQPKVVAGTIACVKEIVESFGVPALGNIKPVLRTIPKIFGHSDKTVRAEGQLLVIALYTYLGAALTPSLSELKPLQMTEIQKSIDALDAEGKGAGTGRPTRWTRKVQREREAAEASGDAAEEADDTDQPATIDPLALLDPVDVLSKFPNDLMDRLSSAKWKDRLESLEECNKVLALPQNAKISDNNVEAYGMLVQTLGSKCKSDANVNVVIEAARLLEGLATGLGKSFGRFRGVTMSSVMERLKERKANVVEALGKALDAIFHTTTLSDITEDVLVNLKHKNPQVKEGTLKFFHRSLQTTPDAPGKDQIKPIAETLVSLLGDSLEPIRTSAADCLGTMMKILGERTFNPYIEGVGELQMAKVKDAFAKAEIRYRPGGAKPSAAPAVKKPTISKPSAPIRAPSSPPISTSARVPSSPPIKPSGGFNISEFPDEFAPPKRAPPARLAPKPKPAVTTSSPPKAAAPVKAAPKPAAKAGPSKTLAVSPSDPVKYRFTPEDAAARATDDIPSSYHTALADAAWKVRLESAEEMVKWVGEEGGAEKVDSEVMMRFLGKTPGWGEKNFQVSAKLYEVMRLMAEKSPTFGKPAAALAIGHLSDKLGDLKLKKPSGDAMAAFAERTSLAFVLAQAYEPMTKQKAPKAQADALTWIKQQLIDFGIAGIPLRDLVAFVKAALQSANAAVRSSATQLLVTVRLFVGADVSGFLEDLNPQLLTTINSEFDKVAGQSPPEPTKTSADLQDAAPASGKAGAKGGADPLDDLIPRVDLDKLVSQTSVVADSRNEAWKVRKEGFEALNVLLEIKSNSRLKANMGEIGGVLKKAMADTNLAVKMLALGIISKIATGMGQPFDKHTRILTAAVASVCADQKTGTRGAALATLTAMADSAGSLDGMYAGIATSIESPNPVLRASVLGWLAERLKADEPSSTADMTPLASGVLSCLEDRNGDVRKAATLVLPFVVANAGFDFVMDQTSQLKPASRATIIPLINNARSTAAPKVAVKPAPSKAAPPTGVKTVKTAPKVAAPPSPQVASAPRTLTMPGRSLAMKALSSVPSTRPPSSLSDDRPTGLPKPRGLARPASVSSHAPSSSNSATFASSSKTSSRTSVFTTSDLGARTLRVKKDATRWTLDASAGHKADLNEYLYQQMEHHTSPEVFTLLFSKDHKAEEDYMVALTTIAEFYDSGAEATFGLGEDELKAIQLANVDLALKYAALKLLSNNTQLNNRCLEVVSNVVALLQRFSERFSDTEAKLFVPALVFKLGDTKFVAKLLPIFDSLDRIMAASQVVGLLVQYGLEDKGAGKTCKNESLQLIEKAYKKRGSILRTKDDRGFYEAVAKCINDSGTRNAALSVMALLQMQGGSPALAQVIDRLPQGSKDMLANRAATIATAKAVHVPVAKVSADALASANSPRRVPPSPKLPSSPRQSRDESANTPSIKANPRTLASPSRGPKTSAPPSANRFIPAPSGLPRGPPSIHSKLQRPSDVFGAARPAMQPLKTAPSSRPTSSRSPDVASLLSEMRQQDINRSVDALKTAQEILDTQPEAFTNNVQNLADVLIDGMDRAFDPPSNLDDKEYFRFVKHLIQTLSLLVCNQNLMIGLVYDDIHAILSCLTLRLVQSDRAGSVDISRFLNMIIIHAIAAPQRLLVFKAMFRLLLSLIKGFDEDRPAKESEVVAHADLILKCLWKRTKILDDDFKASRILPGPLLGLVEEFMQAIGPSAYRMRVKEDIALGDMPLRTVKSMLQKILGYTQSADIDIYEIMIDHFGPDASSTVIYNYIFRLTEQAANRATSRARTPSSREAEVITPVEPELAPPAEIEAVPVESEAVRLVKSMRTKDQSKTLNEIHEFIDGDAEREQQIQDAIVAHLAPTTQLFVRRMLENRKEKSSPQTTSPVRSPTVPQKAARRSLAPRPSSVAVDHLASIDDQLAQLKNVFARGALSASTSHEGGEPLSEIATQPTVPERGREEF